MFTVCPKCALTLVVTAADLRVAQGYVRCGRCSNVFNALARLSEDRHNAAAAAAKAASPAASLKPAGETANRGPAAAPRTPSPVPRASKPSASTAAPANKTALPILERSKTPASDPSGAREGPAGGAPSTVQSAQPTNTAGASPGASTPKAMPVATPDRTGPPRHDSQLKSPEHAPGTDAEDVPDDALEFNPDSTDVTKVFVEQPPSPQFAAATGTFNALRLEAEGSAHTDAPAGQRAASAVSRGDHRPIDPADSQVDVEIDPELLAQMAQIAPPSAPAAKAAAPPRPGTAETPPPKPSATRMLAVPGAAPKPASPSAPKDDASRSGPMPLAARAKARAAAAQAAVLPSARGGRASLASLARAAAGDLGRRATTGETSAARAEVWWSAGSALLALLLTAQIIHHYRNDLAANASLNGPLTSLYAALGMPLTPRWNLGAYEVRQLGASTEAQSPGEITVRASVKNAARQPQPLPLLRVTLQDRFGNRIASRDVPPQSYLPRAIPTARLLSSGQRIDAEMAFVDPGTNAVGFEVDACLPAPDGGISCANDAGR